MHGVSLLADSSRVDLIFLNLNTFFYKKSINEEPGLGIIMSDYMTPCFGECKPFLTIGLQRTIIFLINQSID